MLLFRSKVTLDGYNLILLEGTLKKKKKNKKRKGLDLERGTGFQVQNNNVRKSQQLVDCGGTCAHYKSPQLPVKGEEA